MYKRTKIKLNNTMKILYNNLKYFEKTGNYLNSKELELITKNYYGIPFDSEYNKIIKLPYIIGAAISDFINEKRIDLLKMEKFGLKCDEENLIIKYIKPKNNYFRIHILENEDIIPRNDFIFEDIAYTFVENTPIIITKIENEDEEIENTKFNEFNELLSKELKFLTGLSFLNIFEYNTYITRRYIAIPFDLPNSKKNLQKNEINQIKLIIKLISKLKYSHKINLSKPDGSNFYPIDIEFKNRFKTFLKFYDLNNEVLKRSSYLLYKSNMLFNDKNYLFQEEAYTLLTIAIEGFLKLIAYKEFNCFEKNKTFKYIKNKLKHGNYIAERLIEIYESRTELVHPINDYDVSWNKDISVDDFHEDMDIAKQLLFFYVTGENLEIKEPY